MKKWSIPLSEFLPSTRTGDVVLMHGKFPLSWAIEAIEMSLFSHCGMVIRSSEMGFPAGTPEYLFWEANSLVNLPDARTGKPKAGPMLVDLVARFRSNDRDYRDSRFVFRRLRGDRGPDFLTRLKQFLADTHDEGFPTDLQMLRFLIEGRAHGRASDPSLYFCSQLLTATFQACGLISSAFPPNAFEPKDYSERGSVRWVQRVSLDPQSPVDVRA